MTVVKSNLCPTCGGLLNIDLDKQVYVCPFCGVTFDYEYFREDNVKDVASKAIRRSEYGSAKDAYEFMLAKDPHDFEALRGLFICKNKWQSMSIMKRDSEVHVSADEPTLQNAIDNCRPEHKAYFEKVREALSALRHYRNLISEAKDIAKKKSTEQAALGHLKDAYYQNGHMFTEFCHEVWDMDEKSREALLTFTILLPVLVIGYLIWGRAWPLLIFFAVLAGAGIGLYHLVKAITAARLRARMVPYKKKIEELSAQYDAKKAEETASRKKYNDLVNEFMEMDPVPHKESAAPSAANTPK